MSEYWVSKKKYFCQYCEIYIADDAPSRSQHENGLRHKGNKDRFVRGLYKAGVKKKMESEEEKREMRRVEQAAQAAYARDVGAGHAASSSSSSSSSAVAAGVPAPSPAPKPRAPPLKPSDPYTNYTTAASLGISDPDVERLIEEAKLKRSEGRAGDWVTVVPPPPPPPPPLPQVGDNDTSATTGVKSEQQEEKVGQVRKRVEEPGDEDDGDVRRFKMRKKTAAVGLGEIYDPGVIRVKSRVEVSAADGGELGAGSAGTGSGAGSGAGAGAGCVVAAKMPAASGPVLGGDIPPLGNGGAEVLRDAGPGATEKPSWTRREWKKVGMEAVVRGETSGTGGIKEENGVVDERNVVDERKVADAPVVGASGSDVKKTGGWIANSLRETADENVKEEPPLESTSSMDEKKPVDAPIIGVRKEEDHTLAVLPDVDEKVKEEPTDAKVDSSAGSLFRKRKVPLGSRSSGGRRHV